MCTYACIILAATQLLWVLLSGLFCPYIRGAAALPGSRTAEGPRIGTRTNNIVCIMLPGAGHAVQGEQHRAPHTEQWCVYIPTLIPEDADECCKRLKCAIQSLCGGLHVRCMQGSPLSTTGTPSQLAREVRSSPYSVRDEASDKHLPGIRSPDLVADRNEIVCASQGPSCWRTCT